MMYWHNVDILAVTSVIFAAVAMGIAYLVYKELRK
jgi:hypothetical protein